MLDLVFIDVDGTLVGSSRDVTPTVWAAIDRARALGLRLALCSGRPAFGATRDFALRIDPRGWHIYQNGASVVHAGTGESRSTTMPAAAVSMLIERARQSGRILELYADEDYVVQPDADRARRHADLLKIAYSPRPFETLRGAVVRAQWLIARDEETAVLSEPHSGLTMSPSVAPAMPDSLFINLTSDGVDKGSAVRAVTAAYGLSLDRVMYVGDGRNDAVAMRTVGVPVAMANAEDETLAAARHVVGDVDEDGLVEALEIALQAL